jgi:hypothetical protein
MKPNPFSLNKSQLFSFEKAALTFGLLLPLFKNWQITNHPKGENSPNQRAILNFTPGPQGRTLPLGVNLAPRGEICPLGGMFTLLYTLRGEHSLLFRRMEGEQRISPPGDNFTPRGRNSPLGDNFAPGGKVFP